MTRHDIIRARRDELLTVKEFAALWRVDVRSVYRAIRFGRLAGVARIGREIRIDLAVCLEYQPIADLPSDRPREQLSNLLATPAA